MRLRQGLLPLVAVGLALAGCSGVAWPDQPATSGLEIVWLTASSPVGQTVFALETGLAGVDVFLVPDPAQPLAEGQVFLRLLESPRADAALATASLSLPEVIQPAYYRFQFPPQAASLRHDYYLQLELTGPGRVQVGTGPAESYDHGALYVAGEPAEAQLAFRLVYDPAVLWRGVAGDALTWLGWLVVAGLLFLPPGWALLAWLWPDSALSWIEQLAVAAGLSAALYPLLFLWTSIVGLRLGNLYTWLPLAAGVVGLAALAWKRRATPQPPLRAHLRAWWRSACRSWPDLAFVALAALIFLARFWSVRGTSVPLWGDSYQHAVIAQLLVDHGGLFDSWRPYADLSTFTYHFGFHTLVAVFHWISGAAIPVAVLVVGQILNGLAALTLYPLAVKVGGSRWAGVGAVLLAGLLSPTPMVYTNWGRYTQLAGLVILPVAVLLAWSLLEPDRLRWRVLMLGALTFGGLALAHYRVLIFAVVFVAVFLIIHTRRWRSLLPRLALLGVGGGLLFLPWFLHVYAGKVMGILAAQVSAAPSSASVWAEQNTVGDPALYPMWFWLSAGLCLAAGLWRREHGVAQVGAWVFGLVLIANPQWLQLPGQGALSNFAVFIAAYVAAALLIGAGLAWLAGLRRRWLPPALAVVVLLLGLAGARARLGDVRPAAFALVTRADQRAAAWIDDRLPAQARLLVNSFFAYSDSVAVGSDGGWWLPLLAHRATSLPPINYSFEQGDSPDYIAWVNAVPRAQQSFGIADERFLALLAERGYTHVYVGQKHGRVNYGGPHILDPQALLASPRYRPVYHQDRVWIFEIVP